MGYYYYYSFPCFFHSRRVAGMTDDLSTACRPVNHSPVLFKNRCHEYFHLVFGRSFVLFPRISVFNIVVITCSSSLLFICLHQFNRLSVIFWKLAPPSLSIVWVRSWSCLCVSSRIPTLASSSRLPQSVFWSLRCSPCFCPIQNCWSYRRFVDRPLQFRWQPSVAW